MQPGYYWATYIKDNKDRIVEVVDRLPDHVLYGGYSWPRTAYSDFDGPLHRQRGQPHEGNLPPTADTSGSLMDFIVDLSLKLNAAYAELHELRIRVGLGETGDTNHD